MNDSWKVEVSQGNSMEIPDYIVKFFHNNLVFIEKGEKLEKLADWRTLKSLQKKLNISIQSDTERERILIPAVVEIGSIYYKGYHSKSKSFLKDLRHAFAHDYIIVENKEKVKIALPYKGKPKELKLVCYLYFSELKQIVNTLKKQHKK